MLRITKTSGPERRETLTLEGKLVGPWVEALRQACATARPRLDLAAVDFADAAGVALLRALIASGATVAACSGLVAELLNEGER